MDSSLRCSGSCRDAVRTTLFVDDENDEVVPWLYQTRDLESEWRESTFINAEFRPVTIDLGGAIDGAEMNEQGR